VTLRGALRILSPGGLRGHLSVLIFHRVLQASDPLSPDIPDAAAFEAQMQWVKTWFTVLPLADAIHELYAGRLPPRALSITFDDGYADNEEVAAPILSRLELTATFFVATGFLGGGCMFNDRVIEAIRGCSCEMLDLTALGIGRHSLRSIAERRQAIDDILNRIKYLEQAHRDAAADAIELAAKAKPALKLMMAPGQVRALRTRGMDIGAHTISHPILTKLTHRAAAAEIGGGKEELERIIGERVRLFAYPNGMPGNDYAGEHAQMARDCGFEAAVSTIWGSASMRTDRFQIPRFTPWDRSRLGYGIRLMANVVRSRFAHSPIKAQRSWNSKAE